MAAGEALAVIFEMGSLDKFCGETKDLKDSSDPTIDEGKDSRKLMYLHGLRTKVLGQVRVLSAEAGGKGSAKKDLTSQRNTFRDILDFLEVCSICLIYFDLVSIQLKFIKNPIPDWFGTRDHVEDRWRSFEHKLMDSTDTGKCYLLYIF